MKMNKVITPKEFQEFRSLAEKTNRVYANYSDIGMQWLYDLCYASYQHYIMKDQSKVVLLAQERFDTTGEVGFSMELRLIEEVKKVAALQSEIQKLKEKLSRFEKFEANGVLPFHCPTCNSQQDSYQVVQRLTKCLNCKQKFSSYL